MPEPRPAADRTQTIGVYRVSDATFYLRNTNTRGAAFYLRNSNTFGDADLTVQYGGPTDLPLAGNWS